MIRESFRYLWQSSRDGDYGLFGFGATVQELNAITARAWGTNVIGNIPLSALSGVRPFNLAFPERYRECEDR